MKDESFQESFEFAFQDEDLSDVKEELDELFPKVDISYFDLDDTKKVYFEKIWLENKLDEIESVEVSKKIFDFSRALGSYRTSIIVQRSLSDGWEFDLVVDGDMGEKEVGYINRIIENGERDFFLSLFCHRVASFYEVFSKKTNIRDLLRWVFR